MAIEGYSTGELFTKNRSQKFWNMDHMTSITNVQEFLKDEFTYLPERWRVEGGGGVSMRFAYEDKKI
jgi:hypothetical protein